MDNKGTHLKLRGDDTQGTYFGGKPIHQAGVDVQYTNGPLNKRDIDQSDLPFDYAALTDENRRSLGSLRAQQKKDVESVGEEGPTEKAQTQTQEMLMESVSEERSTDLDPPSKSQTGSGNGKGKRPPTSRNEEPITADEIDSILEMLSQKGLSGQEGENNINRSDIDRALNTEENREDGGKGSTTNTETNRILRIEIDSILDELLSKSRTGSGNREGKRRRLIPAGSPITGSEIDTLLHREWPKVHPKQEDEDNVNRSEDYRTLNTDENREDGGEDSTAESHSRSPSGNSKDTDQGNPTLQLPEAEYPYAPQGVWMALPRSLAPLKEYPEAKQIVGLLRQVSNEVFYSFRERRTLSSQVMTYEFDGFSIRISYKNPFFFLYPFVQHTPTLIADPSQYTVMRPKFPQALFGQPQVKLPLPMSAGPPGLSDYNFHENPSLLHWIEMQSMGTLKDPNIPRGRIRNKDGMGGMFVTTDNLFGIGYRIYRTKDGIPDGIPDDPSYVGNFFSARNGKARTSRGRNPFPISRDANGVPAVGAQPHAQPQRNGLDSEAPARSGSDDRSTHQGQQNSAASAAMPADPGYWGTLRSIQRKGIAPGILWFLITTLSNKFDPGPSGKFVFTSDDDVLVD